MSKITLVEAVTQALGYELAHDDNVVLLGEDIGVNGGVFRATDGLQARFGADRVIDTPLAESMIAGLAIGMAAQGLKPVAEFQFMGFIYSALDNILNHAARMRNRTRGRLQCPAVFRAPFGGGIHAPEHHSESTEAMFAHIPGLQVVIPSSPARAYGLLCRNFSAQAADELAQNGISAEIIDVATVKPLDTDTIIQSIQKTGRCVIVHEAAKSGGLGGEIAAQIAEKALLSLLAPIQRVTGYDTTIPYFKLEYSYIPSVERILHAVNTTMEYV